MRTHFQEGLRPDCSPYLSSKELTMSWLEPSLPLIWLFIIGFFLLYYAVADGFDLGVGIISLFARSEQERSLMMGSMASIWHDNQTWLVLLGGMLFGAFPLFYSLVLASLYIPILLILFGLIFRGVAMEFREHSRYKYLWGLSFGIGSFIITIAQGFALGGLLGGLPIQDGKFTGSVWAWLTPYSAVTAFGVLCGYTMLGANYLILKTEGEIQQRSYRISLVASVLTLMVAVTVHLWTTARYPYMAQRWTTTPSLYYVAGFLLLAVIAFGMFFISLHKRREHAPLFWNVAIILFSFISLSTGLYPHMIPNVIASPITVQRAAASPKTLMFMLTVMVVLIPVILTYTSYKHRVFRGKVTLTDYAQH
jgi:cytochrome d ubiquinol oxidase subunit II